MPSPFPGMNPYLEQESYWQDFHQTFIPMARASLAEQLSPRYFVRVEQYVFIHELDGESRRPLARPDLFVKEARPSVRSTSTITTEAPAYAYLPVVSVDEERHSYLSIRDRDGDEAITIIELLSPSNKNPAADRTDYLKKRREFFGAGLNLVVIDLLRGGPRLPFSDVPACVYLVSVSRASNARVSDFGPSGFVIDCQRFPFRSVRRIRMRGWTCRRFSIVCTIRLAMNRFSIDRTRSLL